MKKTSTYFFVSFLLIAATTASAKINDVLLLKNFREIYASYQAITEIDGRSPDLLDIYKLNVDRLPKMGLPEELSSPAVLAMTELAGAFCKKAVDKEKVLDEGERTLFSLVDFQKGPSQFDDYSKNLIEDQLALAFWQREATPEEKASMGKILDDLKKENNTAAATEKMVQVLCTFYGTSLAFLVK